LMAGRPEPPPTSLRFSLVAATTAANAGKLETLILLTHGEPVNGQVEIRRYPYG
jgi:hypothetical protein